MFRFRLLIGIVILVLIVAACDTEGVPQVTPTPAPSPTNTPEDELPTAIAFVVPSETPLPTSTSTLDVTLTSTSTVTLTASNTATVTATDTPNPSQTFTLTPTNTPTASATNTATDTPTNTPTETNTVTVTATDTPNPSQTFTLTPTETPTSTATNTATNTPTETAIPSDTPTPTQTATETLTKTPNISETPTQIPTLTPSLTPTITLSPTLTNTPSETPLPTPTPFPTIGASSTPTATVTPTATSSATNTLTPQPTDTPTNTPVPTDTPLPPTLDLTVIANQLTQTSDAFFLTLTALEPTQTETATAVPAPSQTNTLEPAPTLDVTPTFITAEPENTIPPQDLGIITPIPSTEDTVEQFGPSETPTPAPTVNISVPIPATITVEEIGGGFEPAQPVVRPFGLTTSGGFGGGGLGSLPSNTNLFVQNPANPSQYAITNGVGTLFTVSNGIQVRPNTSPFSEFEPQSLAENTNFVSYMQWAPNGRYLAFVIDGDRYSNPTDNDGIHIYDPVSGASFDILRDCPYEGHPGCDTGGARQFLGATIGLQWSPISDRVVATLQITNGRRVQYVITLSQDPNQQPQTALYYDYASWTRDGTSLIVSGQNPSGAVIIGTVNSDGSGEQVLLNASALGLWVQDAMQSSNGNIYALGRPGGSNGAMAIYDAGGNQLTGFIGNARPSQVAWSPDGTAVYVRTSDGRRYVANINGAITDITDQAGNNAVNWIYSPLPAISGSSGAPSVPSDAVPSGVVEGSQYAPGQQLRVLVESLNVRAEPDANSQAIGSLFLGEYVAILAGPAPRANLIWWQVQTANGTVGWIAAEINGFASIGF